jgi:hypothetical protein
MARTDTLSNYLTDVASAIKTKKGDNTPILASNFDTEITNLPSGGGGIDWTEIGYTGTPDGLIDSFNDAKDIADNWQGTPLDTIKYLYGSTYSSTIKQGILVAFPLVDTSNVTSFNSFFSGFTSLLSVPVLDTSSGQTFNSMFNGCASLRKTPNFDLSSATNVNRMFYSCYCLKEVDTFGSNSITNFSEAFRNCRLLKTVRSLNISGATNTESMFNGCANLEDLPQMSAPNLSSDNSLYMFGACNKLTDASLNNIMGLCITMTTSTTKTITMVGVNPSTYPLSRVQNLSNYQSFVNAGWSWE